MRKIKLARLVNLGGAARYLFDAKQGWTVRGDNYILSNIDSLLTMLLDLNFKVTLAGAQGLLELKNEIEAASGEAKLSATHALRLNRVMDRLRHTLRSEASTLTAYVLSERRYDVEKLVEEPQSLLAEGTFRRLPFIAQLDLKEAGKCLGFELPTAGAFHLLRATEGTLKSYYRVFIRRGNIEKANWGELITRLRKTRKRPAPDEALLNHLDHIRKNFRNPTDHPQMVYDMDGSQDLFSLVADVLNRMAKELPEKESEPIDEILLSSLGDLTSLTVPVSDSLHGTPDAGIGDELPEAAAASPATSSPEDPEADPV